MLLSEDLPGVVPVVGPSGVTDFPEISDSFVTIGSIYNPKTVEVRVPAFYFKENKSRLELSSLDCLVS